jgi:hypothetical protein
VKPLLVAGLVTASALAACILPDRDIQIVNEGQQNRHAIRIVEPIELTDDALAACEAAASDADLDACPQPGVRALPHFLDPALDEYDFCACASLEQDSKKLAAVTLYVEDRDEDRDGNYDKLYAALQLDLVQDDPDPDHYVQYTDFISPTVPLTEDDQLQYQPLGRPDPHLRVLELGSSDDPIDLCNDLDRPLARGFHTLRLIVTDKPWFADAQGRIQPGVPDLAGGATYDTATYVFFCGDKNNEADDHCLDQCIPKDGV